VNVQYIQADQLCHGPGLRPFGIDKEKVDRMSGSVDEHGIMTPVQVLPKNKEGKYPIISGHHRWQAAIQVNKKRADDEQLSVPCVINNEDAETVMAEAVILNVQQDNYSPAELYKILQAEADHTAMGYGTQAFRDHCHRKFGVSASQLAKLAKLTDLPEETLKAIHEGLITLDAVIALVNAKLPISPKQWQQITAEAIDNAKQRVASGGKGQRKAANVKDVDAAAKNAINNGNAEGGGSRVVDNADDDGVVVKKRSWNDIKNFFSMFLTDAYSDQVNAVVHYMVYTWLSGGGDDKKMRKLFNDAFVDGENSGKWLRQVQKMKDAEQAEKAAAAEERTAEREAAKAAKHAEKEEAKAAEKAAKQAALKEYRDKLAELAALRPKSVPGKPEPQKAEFAEPTKGKTPIPPVKGKGKK